VPEAWNRISSRLAFLPRTNIPKRAVIPKDERNPRIKKAPKQPRVIPTINGMRVNIA